MLHGHVVDGHVHLGHVGVPGAGHLEDGAEATAYVRPHDVRIGSPDDQGTTSATVERVSSLGWLSRVVLKLPDGHELIAHVPAEELSGVEPGATVSVDLRNPKAFHRADAAESAI